MVTTRLAHGLSLLLTTFVLLAALPSLASAQRRASAEEKRARVHFEEGRQAFTEGRYDDALLHFQESYTLSHRPALLFNIGNVLDRLRRDDEAIVQYQQYLNEVPDAANRDQVEERLAVLKRSAEERRAAQAATAVVVPTPREVAAAQQPVESAPSAPAETPSETRPLYKKWWVWTAVGSAVVAAVVIGVVAGGKSSEQEQSALVVDGMTRQVEL